MKRLRLDFFKWTYCCKANNVTKEGKYKAKQNAVNNKI